MRGVSSGSRPVRAAFSSAGLWGAREVLPGTQQCRTAALHTSMLGGSPAVGLTHSMWLGFSNPLQQCPSLLAAPAGRASPQVGPAPPPEDPAPASACPNHLHPAWLQPVPWPMPWLPRSARHSTSASCPGRGHLLPSASPWRGQEEARGLPVVGGGGGAEGTWLGMTPVSQLGNQLSS